MRGFGFGMGYYRIAREMRYYIRREIWKDSGKQQYRTNSNSKRPPSVIGIVLSTLGIIYITLTVLGNPFYLFVLIPFLMTIYYVKKNAREREERESYDKD
jgi:hypothetical protein